ncbi:hypothetical protein PN446_20480, partial [Microcystis aeruginosa CS-567/02]|nr:hypothetical protein [Microcystis aeruginosa CS-567/02]
SCLLSPVSCLLSPVSCLLSPVSCLLTPLTNFLPQPLNRTKLLADRQLVQESTTTLIDRPSGNLPT